MAVEAGNYGVLETERSAGWRRGGSKLPHSRGERASEGRRRWKNKGRPGLRRDAL
jgi:hypothetical protein